MIELHYDFHSIVFSPESRGPSGGSWQVAEIEKSLKCENTKMRFACTHDRGRHIWPTAQLAAAAPTSQVKRKVAQRRD